MWRAVTRGSVARGGLRRRQVAATPQNKTPRAKGERAAKPRRGPERSAGLQEEGAGRAGWIQPGSRWPATQGPPRNQSTPVSVRETPAERPRIARGAANRGKRTGGDPAGGARRR